MRAIASTACATSSRVDAPVARNTGLRLPAMYSSMAVQVMSPEPIL
jgi:hypothetical protein